MFLSHVFSIFFCINIAYNSIERGAHYIFRISDSHIFKGGLTIITILLIVVVIAAVYCISAAIECLIAASKEIELPDAEDIEIAD